MAPTISSGDGLFVYEATQLSKAQPSPLLTSFDAGESVRLRVECMGADSGNAFRSN